MRRFTMRLIPWSPWSLGEKSVPSGVRGTRVLTRFGALAKWLNPGLGSHGETEDTTATGEGQG